MFCVNGGCPLNAVTLDETSTGLNLITGFFANSHQPDYVFTPDQMNLICNEIVCLIQKYKECREAMCARFGANAAATFRDFIVSQPHSESENMMRQYEAPIENVVVENLNTNHIVPQPASQLLPKTIGSNAQSPATPQPKTSGFNAQPPMSNGLNTQPQCPLPRQFAGFNAPSQLPIPSAPPLEAEGQHQSYGHDEHLHDMNRLSLQSDPAHFLEILNETGHIGLRKKESLQKVSNILRRPLGCCYDEARQCWAIADSGDNRVLLYPEGTTIESPKFLNPASVCVVRPGETLAVLSDTCLSVYIYDTEEVAIVIESYGGKIGCRGLACTPLGNIVTIQRKGYNFEAVIFDMSSQKNYGNVVSRTRFKAQNPSFCGMKGNRLVISDLGNQTLTMIEYDQQETNAINIKQTVPAKWNHVGEPNGSFDFVSGVQVDSKGWSIVADAGGRTVQLFDQDLKFVCRVGCDFPMPFTSAIAINSKREVMIIPRSQPAEVIVASLESFNKLPPILGGSKPVRLLPRPRPPIGMTPRGYSNISSIDQSVNNRFNQSFPTQGFPSKPF